MLANRSDSGGSVQKSQSVSPSFIPSTEAQAAQAGAVRDVAYDSHIYPAFYPSPMRRSPFAFPSSLFFLFPCWHVNKYVASKWLCCCIWDVQQSAQLFQLLQEYVLFWLWGKLSFSGNFILSPFLFFREWPLVPQKEKLLKEMHLLLNVIWKIVRFCPAALIKNNYILIFCSLKQLITQLEKNLIEAILFCVLPSRKRFSSSYSGGGGGEGARKAKNLHALTAHK